MRNSETARDINLSLYPSTINKARQIATEEGRSLSNLVRWLIESFYSQRVQEEGQSKLA